VSGGKFRPENITGQWSMKHAHGDLGVNEAKASIDNG